MNFKTSISTPLQDAALERQGVALASCTQPGGPHTMLRAVTLEPERVIVQTFAPSGLHTWCETSVPSEDWGDPAEVSDPDPTSTRDDRAKE